jgi:hypothetical protein
MPFKQSELEKTTGRIVPSSYQYALVTLFWLWGTFGFLINVGLYVDAMGKAIGVSAPATMSATLLLWIGGMLLFGIGALINPRDYLLHDRG